MKKIKSLFCVAICAISLSSGCARQISPGVYSGASVGEASISYPGVVISARPVVVEDKEYLEENGLGILGGGAAGAYLGSKAGKGEGNILSTIGGALAGATAGAFAEKALKSQNAMEYVVTLENGESRSVVQGMDPTYAVGQKVWVLVSGKGRSRVVVRQ